MQRRVPCRGALVVAKQRIHVGIVHAGQTLTVEAGDNAKKQGKTLKEKQAAKKLEKAKRRETSHIPPTGH